MKMQHCQISDRRTGRGLSTAGTGSYWASPYALFMQSFLSKSGFGHLGQGNRIGQAVFEEAQSPSSSCQFTWAIIVKMLATKTISLGTTTMSISLQMRTRSIALSYPRIASEGSSKVNLPSTVSIVHESSRFQLGALISWRASGTKAHASRVWPWKHIDWPAKAVIQVISSPSRAHLDIYGSGGEESL